MSLLDPPPSYDGSLRRTKSDRAHRRPKPRKYVADTIDRLDTSPFGGPYHHGGPYDATMKSFNLNSKFSPVAAVRQGNEAAWRATPREAKLDALLKGRPLDGTASVPPGERALNGELMDYEYSTDMLRDPHAGGGPYRQWPGVVSTVFSFIDLVPTNTAPPSCKDPRADAGRRNTTRTTSRARGSPASPWTGNGGPRRALHGLSLSVRGGVSMSWFPSGFVVAATCQRNLVSLPS